jgi:hypothetical protein
MAEPHFEHEYEYEQEHEGGLKVPHRGCSSEGIARNGGWNAQDALVRK